MYKSRQNQIRKTTIKHTESYDGESLEKKIARLVNNKEPLTEGAPIIYTERKDGVLAAYDIRTDRWEIAVDGMQKVSQHHLEKRDRTIGEKTYDTMTDEQKEKFHKKHPQNKYTEVYKTEKQTKTEGGA